LLKYRFYIKTYTTTQSTYISEVEARKMPVKLVYMIKLLSIKAYLDYDTFGYRVIFFARYGIGTCVIAPYMCFG